jgi:putative restriction endonuclease
MVASTDSARRERALSRLDELVDEHGPLLSRAELRNCLPEFDPGHLVDRQKGIWNPNWLDATLSVLTVPDSSYPDKEIGDGVWVYSYRRGTTMGDNRKLQLAYETGVDLAYFRPASDRLYEAIYPVRVVENYREEARVVLARLDIDRVDWREGEEIYLRSWAERTVMQRLHQGDFRRRVMRAYSGTCAICLLKYEQLLDAAHIDRDRSDEGDPHTNNGIALCKIHHRAYDLNLIGISPTYVVKVKASVRRGTDGPMLLHGLQQMHGRQLWLPEKHREQPLPERLERRYREFNAARVGT